MRNRIRSNATAQRVHVVRNAYTGGRRSQASSEHIDGLYATLRDWNGPRSAEKRSPRSERRTTNWSHKASAAVDNFLASLALGTDRNSIQLENRIGAHLYETEVRCRELEEKTISTCERLYLQLFAYQRPWCSFNGINICMDDSIYVNGLRVECILRSLEITTDL
jgi:hypothetical protein